MTVPLPLMPRAGTGAALLLALLSLVLISTWPERPDVANTSWYTLAPVRATALAVWAWLLGTGGEAFQDEAPLHEALARLALGALLTAPLEAFAHAVSAPTAPPTWSLLAPLPLAWACCGIARGLALAARRLRVTAALPLLAPSAAAALLVLDLRLGLGWWTPWTLSLAPSAGSAAVLTLAALAVLAWAWRSGRTTPEPGGST